MQEKELLRILDAEGAETAKLYYQQEEERLRIKTEAAEATRLKKQEETCLRIEAEAAETAELRQQQEEERLRINEAEAGETTRLEQ